MVDVASTGHDDIAVDYERMVARLVRLMRTSTDPLTLDDLAESAGLSSFHLTRIFRSVAGIPPVEFQAALRFERAKSLLLTTPASVTEICFEVGYDSLGTLSRRFNHLVGVSPARFRELPEAASGLDLSVEITRGPEGIDTSPARVEGTVVAARDVLSPVYIGLYIHGIAASRPVVGQMLPRPGPFLLSGVPRGSYHLLAAALPMAGDAIAHLVPGDGIQVGVGQPVDLHVAGESIQRNISLRSPSQVEPPLLTALPAMLL